MSLPSYDAYKTQQPAWHNNPNGTAVASKPW